MTIGKPKILNVDDDEGSRYAVTRILQHAGFDVGEAANGEEAVRFAHDYRPDLVLLDVNLPDISGFEVCRRLKAAPETWNIPVMHISASSSKSSDLVSGLEAGAEAYLVEPVEPEVLVATIRAVLRARHAEELARGLAREWESTFDAIRDGVAVVDVEGKIQRANESMGRLLQRKKSELVGLDCAQLFPTLPPERAPFTRALLNRQRESVEIESNGRRINITVDPMFEPDGRPAGAVKIISDVTETRHLEEQFREAQKFETVGTLAAGVAHDFNNLLTSIMGNSSLVLGDLDDDSPFHSRLLDVLYASQRAAELTRQLLAYSGKGRHFLQKFELSTLLPNMRGLIEAAVSKKITVDWHLTSPLPQIQADPNQVQQLVMNLVSNAAEAIGENPGLISITTGLDEAGGVYLEVTDNGCGMDPETKSRIFDPFFTTKFTGRGLGLAAVAGIVRGHKATIQVHSGVGEGASFRVSFDTVAPANVAPSTNDAPPAKHTTAAGSKATVLVVDDEDMVRRIAQATLEIRGYRVLLASNGVKAIQMVQDHPQIAIVLLDLTMPVMSGAEAIDHILAARPGLQVIVSTGFSPREAAARFNRKPVQGYLHKPYTSKQLADLVEALLQTGQAAHSVG